MDETRVSFVQKDFGCCRGQLFSNGYQWHQFTCVNWAKHYQADRMKRAKPPDYTHG